MARLNIGIKETHTHLPESMPEKYKFTSVDCNKIVKAINDIDTDMGTELTTVAGDVTTVKEDLATHVSNSNNLFQEINNKIDGLNPGGPVITVTPETFSNDKDINDPGIYIFTGGNEKTATIADGITGIVEFRNVGEGLLKFDGEFAPGFSKELYPRSQSVRLIWANGFYTY